MWVWEKKTHVYSYVKKKKLVRSILQKKKINIIILVQYYSTITFIFNKLEKNQIISMIIY